MTERVWFITGVTGFVGREVLRRILDRTEDRVIGLVRAASSASLDSRRAKVLEEVQKHGVDPRASERFEVIRGDLSSPKLGLDDGTWDRIATTANQILHLGASVRFDLSLEEARKHNVTGTRQVLELGLAAVDSGQLERFGYVGTCYVAGDRTDTVMAEELDKGQSFRNTYEQTKFESEKMVREHMDRLPISVFRPSIIVGDSRTGETTSFNVIYWPLQIYARGWWPLFFIGNMDAPADVVPVNFVSDALLYLMDKPGCEGRCFPLAAGVERCCTNGTVIKLASTYFDRPMPEVIKPEEFTDEVRQERYDSLTAAQKSIIAQGIQYLPYFGNMPLFDTTPTVEALAGSGIEAPEVEDYFIKLFDYCKRSEWGRKPLKD